MAKKNLPIGKVVLYTDFWWTTSRQLLLEKLVAEPKSGDQIRIVYSMFESSAIPAFWTTMINRYFDAVVVPDPYFVDVYKNSGVARPIFALPMCVDYRHFLSKPLKIRRHTPMVFADLSSFVPRKNHLTLLRAFHKAFKNQTDVLLTLNGRYSQGDLHQDILSEVRRLGLTQVVLTKDALSLRGYIDQFQTVDCYVTLSKGEGFSIPPREAMAQGIPVICADNTALTTICKSGLVRAVPATFQEPAYSHGVQKGYFGHFFNCTVDDAAAALRNVYDHYDAHLQRAEAARQWASRYDNEALKPLYLSLVKPKQVLLGHENRITAEYLMTDSKELYQKYI